MFSIVLVRHEKDDSLKETLPCQMLAPISSSGPPTLFSPSFQTALEVIHQFLSVEKNVINNSDTQLLHNVSIPISISPSISLPVLIIHASQSYTI